MYQRLKEPFALRGWKGLPYGITDTRSGRTALLDTRVFQAVSFCDGKTDLDSPLVLPSHREAASQLLQVGFVEECEPGQGLADYQKYRKTESRFADSVHWSITGACNMNCRHCYLSAPQAKYGELTTEQCLHIIDQISAANIGKVSLTGGEPLVRNDFWILVDALREKRIAIHQLYTNGLLLTDEVLDQLKERGIDCTIFLSFDCCDHHDWMRGMPGAEQAVIETIKRVRRHEFPVGIETSLYNGNLPKLMQTYELLRSLDITSWKVSPTVSVGNWELEQGQYDISRSDLYDAYLQLIQRFQADHAPFTMMLGGFYYCEKGSNRYHIPMIKFDGSEKMLKQTVCRSCRIHLYLMADGKLLPCIPMTGTTIEDQMPNLLSSTITEALEDSRYFEFIDMRLGQLLQHNSQCADCEHRLRCGMGCRAHALQCSGSYAGVDPDCCFYYKNGYEERVKELHFNQ